MLSVLHYRKVKGNYAPPPPPNATNTTVICHYILQKFNFICESSKKLLKITYSKPIV